MAITGGVWRYLDRIITRQSMTHRMVMHSNHFAMHLVQIGVIPQQYLIFDWYEFIQLAGWARNDDCYGFGDG